MDCENINKEWKGKISLNITETLKRLCEADGVSGAENNACCAAAELLRKYAPNAKTDSFGNVTAFIGDKNNGKKTLLLEAHIDEIGFIVTYIDDKGFIKVGECGGTDRRLYAAQTVTIHGNAPVRGIIATLPPHVQTDSKSAMKAEDIVIDTGYAKEELEKLVSLGDRVTIDGKFSAMNGTRVTGKAIDDRGGVAAVLYALDLLKGKETQYNIAVLFASQEETGSRGAKIGAYNADADIALATDVSFAYTPGAKKEKCGVMGKGAMIGIAPVLSGEVTDELKKLAADKNIPVQFEVMGGDTGTDADEISIAKSGVKTGLISIPLKYMHTPVEVVDVDDICAVGRLMAEFAVKKGVEI